MYTFTFLNNSVIQFSFFLFTRCQFSFEYSKSGLIALNVYIDENSCLEENSSMMMFFGFHNKNLLLYTKSDWKYINLVFIKENILT